MINIKKWLPVILVCLLPAAVLLSGCGGDKKTSPAELTTVPPVENEPSGESIIEIQERVFEKYKDQPELIEAAIYAEFNGITVEEAQERFSITDKFRGVEGCLESKAPETFAGFWIQHEPDFCVVAAFTSGGEDIVKECVSGDLLQYVEVRNVRYSMKDLWRDRNQVESFLRSNEIRFDSAIYVIDNNVGIRVEDRTEIDKAVEDGILVIPDSVVISTGGLAKIE